MPAPWRLTPCGTTQCEQRRPSKTATSLCKAAVCVTHRAELDAVIGAHEVELAAREVHNPAAVAVRRRPVKYVLHVYDHCPFCNRVEWLMQRHGLPYRREVYGYGAGARPEKCDGHGYGEGPLHLTGKKMLPVLEGPGVPVAAG